MDRLDYIVALGCKGIYIAGTPLLNLPWDSHYYNPYDFSLVDAHLGTVAQYRAFIEAAHKLGIYVVVDLTITTAADFLYFDGYFNHSTPLRTDHEYEVYYKNPLYTYPDFSINNTWDQSCNLNNVKFSNDSGYGLFENRFGKGCYSGSDFDQFGDVEAFGSHPIFQRQVTKFGGVQVILFLY